MIYTLKSLITKLNELAKDAPDAKVAVIGEKQKELERKDRHSVSAHHAIVGVERHVVDAERHGDTILLTYRDHSIFIES
jgi:hypothetical protein